MRGGRGQTPRRTSSSEKREEADKPTKEKKTGREVRGDPRGGSRKPGQGRECQFCQKGSRSRGLRWSFAFGCGKVIVPFISPVTGVAVTGQWKGKGGPSRR